MRNTPLQPEVLTEEQMFNESLEREVFQVTTTKEMRGELMQYLQGANLETQARGIRAYVGAFEGLSITDRTNEIIWCIEALGGSDELYEMMSGARERTEAVLAPRKTPAFLRGLVDDYEPGVIDVEAA